MRTPGRAPRSSTRSSSRASPPDWARPVTCRSTPTCTRSGRPTPTCSSTPTAALAVERGIAELAITDHVDFDPDDARLRVRVVRRSRADVREAGERWADRGLAIRFGVEVTYERRYEDEIRGWLRRHPHDYVIGSVHISARLAVQGGSRRRLRRGPPARRRSSRRTSTRSWGRRSPGCSTRSATSTSSSAISYPHVLPADLAAAPELYERVLVALVESGTALEVNTSGLRQLAARDVSVRRDRRPLPGARREACDHRLGRAPDGVVRLWPGAGVSSASERRLRGAGVPARRRSGTGSDAGTRPGVAAQA